MLKTIGVVFMAVLAVAVILTSGPMAPAAKADLATSRAAQEAISLGGQGGTKEAEALMKVDRTRALEVSRYAQYDIALGGQGGTAGAEALMKAAGK